MIFEFRLILKPIEISEKLGNALYEAGCVVDCAKIEGEFLAPIA